MATAFERFAEAVSNLDAREDIHLTCIGQYQVWDVRDRWLGETLGKRSLGEGPGLSGPTWWRIRVRGAELDRRIFLQAFRELIDDLRNRRDDP